MVKILGIQDIQSDTPRDAGYYFEIMGNSNMEF